MIKYMSGYCKRLHVTNVLKYLLTYLTTSIYLVVLLRMSTFIKEFYDDDDQQ